MRIHNPYSNLTADNGSPSAPPAPGSPDNARPRSGVDEAKVARLRAAVDAGSLQVDGRKIAECMVDGDV